MVDKEKIADNTTRSIKFLLDEMIDNSGIINDLKITFPRTCLSEVLKALDKNEFENMRCQINVYTNIILVHFYNKSFKRPVDDYEEK